MNVRIEKSSNGKYTALLTTEDFTQRKGLERNLLESEERYRTVVENSHQGIVILGDDYKFEYINKAFCEMLGYNNNELTGKDFGNILPDESKQLVTERYIKRQRGEKVPLRYEFNILRKDGKKRQVEVSSAVVKDSKGKTLSVAQLIDITERIRAEKALHHSKEIAESYLNIAAEIILSLDAEGNITLLNESGHKLLGYANGSLIGKNWFTTCLPKSIMKEVRVVFEKLMCGELENIKVYENPVLTSDRYEKIIYWHNSLVKDVHGRITGTLSSGEDITERKFTEEALRESEKRLLKAQEVAQMGFINWDLKSDKIELSAQVIQMAGLNPAKKWSTPELIEQICHPDDQDYVREHLELAIREEKPFDIDLRIVRPDDSVIWVNAKGELEKDEEHKPIKLLETIVDITRRKQAELTISESEARFRFIFNNAPDGYFLMDSVGTFLDGNAEAERIVGYRKEELIGKNVLDSNLLPVEQKRKEREMMRKISNWKMIGPTELILRRKRGKLIPVEVISSPVIMDKKQCILGIARDISERRLIEQKTLIQSAALENAVNGIMITNREGIIEWVNKAFTKITGFAVKEAVGKTPRILKSGKHDKKFYEAMWKTILNGKTWRKKIINKRKNGALYTEELTIAPIEGVSGEITHFVAIQLDVSRQEETLTELHSALNRLHKLSGHLNEMVELQRRQISRNLHDNLGQILTAVKMDISWLSRQLSQTVPRVNERLEETRTLIDEAMKTVQWITTELRPSVLDELGLWDALEWLCDETTKRSAIKTEMELMQGDISLPDDFTLPVYRVVQEALTNVVRHSKATKARLRIIKSKNSIVFSVSDNGIGIQEEKLDTPHTFGLMGMRERVEILGGEFKLSPGKVGTEILFTLPLANQKKS